MLNILMRWYVDKFIHFSIFIKFNYKIYKITQKLVSLKTTKRDDI